MRAKWAIFTQKKCRQQCGPQTWRIRAALSGMGNHYISKPCTPPLPGPCTGNQLSPKAAPLQHGQWHTRGWSCNLQAPSF